MRVVEALLVLIEVHRDPPARNAVYADEGAHTTPSEALNKGRLLN